MRPKDAAGMANRVDPNRRVQSGSVLFALAYLPQYFGFLWY